MVIFFQDDHQLKNNQQIIIISKYQIYTSELILLYINKILIKQIVFN